MALGLAESLGMASALAANALPAATARGFAAIPPDRAAISDPAAELIEVQSPEAAAEASPAGGGRR